MTISANVRKELFEMTTNEGKLIRIKPTEAKAGTTVYSSKQSQPLKMWTQEEHEKFLEAMEKYPSGPWKVIAAFIGTKTTRQTMTHAQKYRQKISRWRRGLRHKGRKQMGDDTSQHCEAEAQDYSAKENLFKAIEYVSGDEMGSTLPAVPSLSPRTGTPDVPRNELFRLAELASIEVMKQEPLAVPSTPSLSSYPQDVEMTDISSPVAMKQSPEEIVAHASVEFSDKIRKMEWGNDQNGSKWLQKVDMGLNPLRTSLNCSPLSGGKFGGVLNAITEMTYQNAQYRYPLPRPSIPGRGMLTVAGSEGYNLQQQCDPGTFRLPPLNITNAHAPSIYSIPPLRSKIDPSVLSGRSNYVINC